MELLVADRETLQKRQRESKTLDFKESVDVNSTRDWVELIKDIVAMANSGGGMILVGMNDNGSPSRKDISLLLQYDPAKIVDKIAKYTDCQFSEFGIESIERDSADVAAVIIGSVDIPMVFTKEGGYVDSSQKDKTAFQKGVIYFRHGAKSEPCSAEDLTKVIERNVEKLRKSWLGNIAQVVQAPIGEKVSIVISPLTVTQDDNPSIQKVRISNEPNVLAVKIDRDEVFPYRLKELTKKVQSVLGSEVAITTGKLQDVRKAHRIDQRPEFMSTAKFGSIQYSEDYASWIVKSYEQNKSFFNEAREKVRKKPNN
jgi:hypothetical protein